jgi:hypothetical protein
MTSIDILKRISKMSREEYNFLQDFGMLWTVFPETTGDYEEDIKNVLGELNEYKMGKRKA